ncbi:hypothetical protein JZ751_026130 [Albula glossodonta]|uniref:SAM domain-containing protein n=1 Tax=Albula glossodonta TaxID=121402 RepID=A0A8T2PL45_9TELE|nr:hypothetical protein JZ751_026130 [Albula glossodonta]
MRCFWEPHPPPSTGTGSESSPHGSPTPAGGPQGGASEEIWVLRKPFAGGDRSSMGSSGSVASARSSGSGQSAGTNAHILHAQAEGVKLLATVLSQSAKAKEHLLEQSKSLEQSTGSASRTTSSSSCPYHEPPYGEPVSQRKGEAPSDGKMVEAAEEWQARWMCALGQLDGGVVVDAPLAEAGRGSAPRAETSSEAVIQWLSEFQLQVYAPNFISAGYDIATVSRMTPETPTAHPHPSTPHQPNPEPQSSAHVCMAGGGIEPPHVSLRPPVSSADRKSTTQASPSLSCSSSEPPISPETRPTDVSLATEPLASGHRCLDAQPCSQASFSLPGGEETKEAIGVARVPVNLPYAARPRHHMTHMTPPIDSMAFWSHTEYVCYLQANLAEWLSMIGLSQYYQTLVHNGYENIDFITDITWEDLQEIGITKLGHQKKLMLAVKKLAEMQRASEGRGSLRKKAPPSQEVMAIESPPHDSAECMSPKMSSFQDSELSNELQTALSRGGEAQEGAEVKPGGQRARSMHENSLGKSRDMEEGSGGSGPPRKEARTARQGSHSQGLQRANIPPALAKPRQSFPPGGGASYTPPQTPTKTKPSSPQTMGPPQGSAKVKPSPQLLAQTERPMSPRSLPQSPTHRGYAYAAPQHAEGGEGPAPQPAVSVPLLCLPPEGEDAEEGQGLPKKRAHSLSRYAASDSEQDRDELTVPDTPKYATMQPRVSRSNSARGQSDKNVNRSQSFAMRPKKKGPPPPPPKRSSSAISSTNLADDAKDGDSCGELLAVNYHERRRASDLGGVVDTGSAGSVKSIAAMLEMSSIGGGPKALAIQRTLCGSGCYLQVSPVHGKHRDGIGLDGEVVNRRRTISGPVTGLVTAARRERGLRESESPRDRLAPEPLPGSANSSAENLPFAEDGNLTIKQRPPRQGRGEGDSLADAVYSLPQEELSRMDATATLKRRVRPKHHQDGVKFQLTESSTVKRRPKSRDKEVAGEVQEGQLLAPYQNGTSTVRRRPMSEMSGMEQSRSYDNGDVAPRRDSADLSSHAIEAEHRKPIKPPVSPKPVLAQQMKKQGPPTPTTKKVPIPGPGGLGSPGEASAPSSVPKTQPPSHGSQARQSAARHQRDPPFHPLPCETDRRHAPVTVRGLCQAPHTPSTDAPDPRDPVTPPLTPGPMPPPVKPHGPPSVGCLWTWPARWSLAQQKLEETSASLAAALQAVEDKSNRRTGRKSESLQRTPLSTSVTEDKTTVSILDDIGSMFDDLADQLDAMLE